MNKFLFLLMLCLSLLCKTFAQDKYYTKHTVQDGETIYQITQKYKITAKDIYDLNPDSKNGIKSDMILIIPKNSAKAIDKTVKTTDFSSKKHEVAQKETLYGIAKQYGITVGDLKTANPILETELLNIGQIIDIPYIKGAVALNPTIKSTVLSSPVVNKNIQYIDYEVKSKETLYGLSKKFNLKIDDLIAINPELANGVQEAMTIKVPASGINQIVTKNETPAIKNTNIVVPIAPKTNPKVAVSTPSLTLDYRNYIDLSKSINRNERKKLSLLLPFNVSKIQNDTVISQQERIKTNKFLNMTLDFYSGALMAIDSAKTLGLNIDVKILDSQETKNSSNIDNLVADYKLQNEDAIIGPFYQSQVDKMAEILKNSSVAIISPLSKEAGKPINNSYASMPSADLLKVAMFDFMRQKSGNIIAVIDNKKASVKQYIADNHSDVKFAEFNDKGVLSTESLKSLLDKDKMNFVVFASERTGMVFSVTNTLINAMSNYQIRLVILEPNSTFDYEEIALSRLTKLKLTYPSLTRENETESGRIFEKEFKKKNKIFPNQYATRGFDVTFDTMLRLSQGQSFEGTSESPSEQVENKFDYRIKSEGGFVNKGIYILQYNSDLTISEAQ